MVRNLIEDVVPPNRRSIRKIPVPGNRGRRLTPKKEDPAELEMDEPEVVPSPPRGGRFAISRDDRPSERSIERPQERSVARPQERRFEPSLPYTNESYDPEPVAPTRGRGGSPRSSSKRMWFIAAGAVLILFVIFSFFFSGTKVTVTPYEEDAVLNTQLSASKNSANGLTYDVMTISKEGDKTVPATGKEVVHRKASGKIIVYNNDSTAEQNLVKNTRFESSGGLIYRTPNDVTIPGKKNDAGKTVPGSIEITVYADQPGEKYNIPQGDFTIPGFKDSPKYKTVYARGKTAMAGGFDGNMNVVSDDVLDAARTTLRTDLSKEIFAEAQGQKPVGTITYEKLAQRTEQSNPETNSADGKSVTIHEKVTLSIPLFVAKNLSDAIGTALHASSTITITNPETLEAVAPGDPKGVESGAFTFIIRGSPHVVSVVDQEKVKQALAGKSRSALSEVLASFPAISKAEVSFRPFWRMSFPSDPTKITVEVAGQ